MAFLEVFSEDERRFLVSLPYRAGVWVSSSDTTGGQESGAQELQALERAIQGIAQGMFESAFVHEVMAETFLRKAEWPEWARGTGTVPDDCRCAIAMMRERNMPVRDVDAYRRILMQIGLEVAKAFREYTRNEPFLYRLTRGIGIAVDRFFGALRGEKYVSQDLLNISYSEDVALNTLAMSLRGTDEGGMLSHS